MTRRAAVSAFIVATLLAQVLAAARPFLGVLQQRRHGALWPFLDYAMYATAHYEGEALDRHVLIGVFMDGTERRLEPRDFRLTLRGYLDGPVAALQQEDRERLVRYVERAQRRLPARLAALRLERQPHVLAGPGLTLQSWQVVRVADRAFWQEHST